MIKADEIHGQLLADAPAALPGPSLLSGSDDRAHRAELEGYAAVFCGHPRWSDASLADRSRVQGLALVLIEQFRARGSAMLAQLTGDFAIAVGATEPGGDGLIAIDRMGICALYYAATPGGLYFGSHLAGVVKSADLTRAIDPQAIFDYVYFHVIPSPRSIYRNVAKLEPGQCIVFCGGRTQVEDYWIPAFVRPNARADRGALAKQTRERIESAVHQCDEGTATGAFLSGGLDSSTVSGMLARTSHRQISTFSIGFDEPGYDELPYAQIAARHFGTRAFEHYIAIEDIEQAVPRLAAYFDEPFGNSSAIPAYICARLAGENGMQTLLAGDGGDELFAGNARYARQMFFEWYALLPKQARQNIFEYWMGRDAAVPKSWMLRKLHRYVVQASTPLPDRMEDHNLLHQMLPADVFTPAFMAQIDTDEPLQALRQRYRAAHAESALDRMLFLDWKFTLADNDLRKVNGACALAGVGVRYPMLDDSVVAVSMQVPARMKLRRMRLRAFYKQAFGDFLPAEILNKPKHGFGLPFGQLLRKSTRLREMIDDSLADLRTRDIFNPAFVERVRESHRSEHAAFYGTMIWVLFMFEQWWREQGPGDGTR